MEEDIEKYGDTGITSRNTNISRWLKLVYVLLPIWGLFWFYCQWNGNEGKLDPDHWGPLQKSANTVFKK